MFNIALFKVCSGHPDYLTVLLKHCHFEMIEEMMRPNSTTRSEFCVLLNEESFQPLVSRLEADNRYVSMKEHPLMSNLKFKDLVEKALVEKETNETSSIKIVT